MKCNRPTSLISDELIQFLDSSSLEKASFQTLSGVKHPWEITKKDFDNIRKKIVEIELDVQLSHSCKTLVCMTTGDAVYWMDESHFEAVREEMKQTIQSLQQNGPMPVWKYTTAEIIIHHLRNIKRLILALAHDSVLLDGLKPTLGDRYKVIAREFQQAERRLFDLLESLREHGSKVAAALNQDMMTLERCRITQTMIQQGESSEEELGYTQIRLNEAIDKLNARCSEEAPGAHVTIRSLNNFSREALREGENSQLFRASRWEILQSLFENAPKETLAVFKIASLEREGMLQFVKSREMELGASESGRKALADAERSVREIQSPKETTVPADRNLEAESPTPPKRVRRMANRERHAYA